MQPGEGNVSAHNALHGVTIGGPNEFGAIRGNSIYANGGLGIALRGLAEFSPLPNNAGDASQWANQGRNYPVLDAATVAGGQLTVQGHLDTLGNLGVSIDFLARWPLVVGALAFGRWRVGLWSLARWPLTRKAGRFRVRPLQ